MKNITDSALDITKGFLTNRDINFKIQREEAKIPNVLADPARLRDVLDIVMSNVEEALNNELNDHFVKKAVEVIHNNMQNLDFDKESFAMEMCNYGRL